MLEVALWLVISLIAISFGEYVFHRWLMHRKPDERNELLWPVWHRHAVQHHGWYYKNFDYEPDSIGRFVNIKLNWYQTALYGVPAAILAGLFSWVGAVVIGVLVVLHHVAWDDLHSEMHIPSNRWFAEMRVYKFLRTWHEKHHQNPKKNFNVVVPLADFIFRTNA